jgi:hypothetical protein
MGSAETGDDLPMTIKVILFGATQVLENRDIAQLA